MFKNNEVKDHGTIKKLRKGAVISALSLSVLGGTQVVSADVLDGSSEVTDPAITPTPGDVEQSNADVAQINQEVTTQEGVVSDAQSTTNANQVSVDTAQETANQAQTVADNATPENIATASTNVTTAENQVETANTNVTTAETAQTDAQTAVDSQTQVVAMTQSTVDTAKQATVQAQTDVNTAQAVLDGTGQAEVVKAQQDAQTAVNADNVLIKQAKESLQSAQLADENRMSNIVQDTWSLDDAKSDVVDTKTLLDNAQNQADTTSAKVASEQADVTTAQNTVSGLQSEIANQNVINVSPEYVNALEAYYASKTSTNAQAVETAGATLVSNNAFKSNVADEAKAISDVNNLTQSEREEITSFATSLLNDVRKPFGTTTTVANESAISMANDIATAYKADSWNSVSEGHYVDEIKKVASNYGLNSGGQCYENLSTKVGTTSDKTIVPTTMAQVKKRVYDTILNLLGKDGDSFWGHATSLTGLKDGATYYGVELSSYTQILGGTMTVNSVNTHIISLPTKYIQDSSKFNIANNLAERDLQAELATAQSSLTTQQAQLATAQTANNQVQSDLVTAKTNYVNAQTALTDAQNALAKAEAVAIKTPTAQTNLDQANAKLVADQATLDQANQALANLTADVKVKQQALADAQAKLASTQAKQTLAEENLTTEQAKLNELNAVLSSANKNVTQAKVNVKSTENNLSSAKQTLTDLQNAPAILAEAKSKLADAQANLEASKATLEEEVAKLEVLKTQQADIAAENAKIVATYQAYLDAQAEAQRLAKIQADLEAIEVNGGVPVPVVNENGIITGYTDGNAQVSSTTAQATSSHSVESTAVAVNHKVDTWSSSSIETNSYLPSTNDKSSVVAVTIGLMLAMFGFAGSVSKRKL